MSCMDVVLLLVALLCGSFVAGRRCALNNLSPTTQASSVQEIVELLGAGTSITIDPAQSPYQFQPGQTMVVPENAAVTVYCQGAVLRACATCTLVKGLNGSAVTFVDCNFDMWPVPPVTSLTPAGVLPVANATTVNLWQGFGTVDGSANFTVVGGSILLSCSNLETESRASAAIAPNLPYGHVIRFSVTPLNDSVSITNIVLPNGYFGGVYNQTNVEVMCSNAPPPTSGADLGHRLLWRFALAPFALALTHLLRR